MASFLCFYLALNLFMPTISTLNCHFGKEVIYAYARSVGGQEVECSEAEAFCLRMESTGTEFDFPVNVTTTACATRKMCENPSCDQLSNTMTGSLYDSYHETEQETDVDSDYGNSFLLFKLRSCEVSCCQEDNCNHRPFQNEENSSSAAGDMLYERKGEIEFNLRAAPLTSSDAVNAGSKPQRFSVFAIFFEAVFLVLLFSHFLLF